MSLNQRIESFVKDKSGSIAKNRLDMQTSFAIKLLVDLYNLNDFIVFMDCIEDVAVHTVQDGKEKIFLYQLKTKTGNFTLIKMLNEKWIQQLYKHKQRFDGHDFEVALVLNNDVQADGGKLFANEKSNMARDVCEYSKKKGCTQNLNQIIRAICANEGITEAAVDLSRYFFIRTNLYTDTHKEQAFTALANFITNFDPGAKHNKLKSFYRALCSTLDDKFRCELNPLATDYVEIQSKKGFTKKEFEKALNDYANESIPEASELFALIGLTSPPEQRKISAKRGQFLIDLFNQDAPFNVFMNVVVEFISRINYTDLLNEGFDFLFADQRISTVYKDEGYLKFALLHTYKCYIDGRCG